MTTATKERPILFSAPMVRAILDGRKTQTRRICKDQTPTEYLYVEDMATVPDSNRYTGWAKRYAVGPTMLVPTKCPYGAPGERLWVRETLEVMSFGAGVAHVRYPADGWTKIISDHKLPDRLGKIPSIHTPRHSSRITLQVVDVGVERVQGITERDAIAEGCQCPGVPASLTNRGAFAKLWESINGEGSWDRNDWVWVVEFKRLEPKQ